MHDFCWSRGHVSTMAVRTTCSVHGGGGGGPCGVTRRESGVLEGTPNLGFGLVDVPLQYLPTGLIF